jgi:RNA polymerase sigma-70 factor, ECF subfamily
MNMADAIPGYATGGGEIANIDESAFQAIYDATSRPLWTYLLRVSGRRDVADDLLQEAYCRFLARKPRGLDEEQTRRYLFRIATNLLRDRWRRRDEMEENEESELAGAERDEALQVDVRRVMGKLKPRERQLLWLAYVEGMNHAEIASVTGLNALSVRMLLFRARRRAAGLLMPGQEGGSDAVQA